MAGKAALSASTLYYVTGGNTHTHAPSLSLSLSLKQTHKPAHTHTNTTTVIGTHLEYAQEHFHYTFCTSGRVL